MANTTFSEFIAEQTAPPVGEPKVDWDERREEWLQYLEQFYQLVEGFMREYLDQGKVRLQRGTKKLHEEFIGDYSVDTMTLDIGPNKILFDPIGTNLIGAKGRVDMRSAKGTVKFVLVPADGTKIGWKIHISVEGADDPVPEPVKPVRSWAWKIATPPPRVRCVELCKDSFQDAIMEVVNG